MAPPWFQQLTMLRDLPFLLDITHKQNVRRLAAVLLPLESAILYPNGNSPGNTMENSGKQNPKMGFKSPPSRNANL